MSGTANPRKAGNGYKMPDGWDTGEGAHGSIHREGREKGRRSDDDRRPKAWDVDMGSNRTLVDGYARQEPPAAARLPGNKTHKGTEAYEQGDEHHRTKGGLVKYAERERERAGAGERMGRGAGWRKEAEANSGTKNNESFNEAMSVMPATRNKRSVWTVGTEPFKEAHFATFLTALIEPCIKAGCPIGGTVIDPFGGAGTTGLVADGLQRNAVLIELNPAYADIARRRIDGDCPLFSSVSIEHEAMEAAA